MTTQDILTSAGAVPSGAAAPTLDGAASSQAAGGGTIDPPTALRDEPGPQGIPIDLADCSIVNDQIVPAREVRAVVTMVGGTSLAIYETGVAQELFRMVHGVGIYGLLKRLTQSHVYIDILSGTSAGGINTICLSTAFAMGTDFQIMPEVWTSFSGIDSLFQDPQKTNIPSIFKGEDYYLKELQRDFGILANPQKAVKWNKPHVPSGWRMKGDQRVYADLDLFVTGTYFRPRTSAFFDALNKPIFSHDYAGVFHLKHRARREESHFDSRWPDPWNPFPASKMTTFSASLPGADPKSAARVAGVQDRLARIARTTSSLPAVFEPSTVDPRLMNGVIDLPNASEDRPDDTKSSYMLDGGFLNNRPINLVLDEIFHRHADGEVQRKVFFVEPVAEELRDSTPLSDQPPSALQNLWFYKDVPGRQSISGALEALNDHNQKALRIGDTLDASRRILIKTGASVEQRNLWVEICLQDLRDDLIASWKRARGLDKFGGDTAINPSGSGGAPQSQDSDPAKAENDQVASALNDHDHLRGEADALRAVSSILYLKIRRDCSRFETVQLTSEGPEPAEVLREAPEIIERPGSFRLAQIDTPSLNRKIMRAINETYRLLYPRVEKPDLCSEPGHTTQSVRQRCVRNLIEANNYEKVKRCIRHLYHLRDIAEIVDETVMILLVTLGKTAEYERARAAATPLGGSSPVDEVTARKNLCDRVDELWNLLVSCLRHLLRPFDDPTTVLLGKAAEGPLDTAAEAQELARIANAMRDEMSSRSDSIRTVLKESARDAPWLKETAEPPSDAAPTPASPSANDAQRRRLLEEQLDDLVCTIARGAAVLLEPSIRLLDKEGNDSLPMAWAFERKSKILTVKEPNAFQTALRDLDALLFPIEHAVDLEYREPLDVVHISARDVQIGFSEEAAENKLAGDVLLNLGGFLKRSWRANDILWGRLDASGAISETLLDRDRLGGILEISTNNPDPSKSDPTIGSRMLQAVEDYVLRGDACGSSDADRAAGRVDNVGSLLQPEYTAVKNKLNDWLNNGYKGSGLIPGQDAGFQALLTLALRRHQMDILMEEAPKVIGTAISEQAEWQGSDGVQDFCLCEKPQSPGRNCAGQPSDVAVAASQKSAQLSAVSGPNPDEVTGDMLDRAATACAKQLLGNAQNQPDSQAVETYFSTRYAVGREDVMGGIPPMVTLHRVLMALLVTLHVLDTSIPAGVKGCFLGKLLVGVLRLVSLVIGALYGFVTVMTQGKTVAAAAHAAAWSVIVLGLAAVLTGMITGPKFTVLAIVGVALLGEILVSWAQRNHAAMRWISLGLVASVELSVLYLAWRFAPDLAQDPPPALHWLLVTLTGRPWWLLLLATLLLLAALSTMGKALRTEAASGGIVSFELAFTSGNAQKIMNSWQAKKALPSASQNLWLDYAFIAAYSITISTACYWGSVYWGAVFPERSGWMAWANAGILLALGSWAAGLLDCIENASLLTLLRMKSAGGSWPAIAGVCSATKFILLFAAVTYVLAAGLSYGLQWLVHFPR